MKTFKELDERKLLKELGLEGSQVLILKRDKGIVILDRSASLTDLLSGLVETPDKEWREEEYMEYLTERSA
jgi:hypothetical protein